MIGLAVALLSATAVDVPGERGRPVVEHWRRVATPNDRRRLRDWRDAWIEGLARARTSREGLAAIVADPALFDPDRSLPGPLPPAGEYQCRTIKLGRQGDVGLDYVAYGWFRCRVFAGQLAKVTGSQRQAGNILPDTDARAVFLGTLLLGDERKPMTYGRDRERDVAGLVERIGPRRWRIAFPYPAFESLLDVLELKPAGQGVAATGTGVAEAGGSEAR